MELFLKKIQGFAERLIERFVDQQKNANLIFCGLG